MPNNLQDRFREIGEGSVRFVATRGEVLDFILSEVEQAKKDLINQSIPKDYRQTIQSYVERKDVGGLGEWIKAVFEDIQLIN